MGDPPLVSAIMPVRNGEEFLAESTSSVLAQSLADLELIIIDDGSTDATAGLAERIACHDPRVRVINQGPEGIPRSRNRGLREARGTFIAWVDSDDSAFPIDSKGKWVSSARIRASMSVVPSCKLLVALMIFGRTPSMIPK